MMISHADIPMIQSEFPKSAISMRSKGTQSMGDEIDELIRENNELRSSIIEIEK